MASAGRPLAAVALVTAGLTAAAWALRRRWLARVVGAPAFVWPVGLSEAEAAQRWRAGQDNTASLTPVRTWENVRRESIFTVFNLNLIGLAVVEVLLAEWLLAATTVGLLALTTGIRVLQDRLAARRLARFAEATAPRFAVIREGRVRSVDADRVVPGDVLVVGPGDLILVDGELLGPAAITVDTSVLTGRRGHQRVRPGGTVHGGTFCVGGRAAYRAERVGLDRALSSRLASRPALAAAPTALERLVARVLAVLLAVVVFYGLLLVAALLRFDLGAPADVVLNAVPVIASLAPTGLYLMIIVSYARGTGDLVRRGALVHSARSVELLAETTVLCFTELGLLAGTSVELTVIDAPDGSRVPESRLRQVLGDVARTTAAPSAVARLLAEAFEGERRSVREEAPHLTTLGWSAIAFGEPDAVGLYVLGEPAVLGFVDDPAAASETLVLAHRDEVVPLTDADGRPRLPDALVPLGTVRFRRQVHPESMAVVRGFAEHGVHVKAFSAGRPDDALDVLRAAGLSPEDERAVVARGVLSGADLTRLPRSAWGRAADEHSLFGGLTPVQVGALVRALRERGEVVTVVGDGVADLPALAEASLAVAQPASTQAALGLADIVLLDPAPGALLRVLDRGQTIVRGLLDVLRLNLTMVVCSALLIIGVRLTGVGFPYVAAQGSAINLLTITVPSLALSLLARAGAVSRQRYAGSLTRFVLPAGATLSLTAVGVYLTVLDSSGRMAHAQLAVSWTLLYAGLLVGVLVRRTGPMAAVAGALAVLATLLPALPPARRQFRLEWLAAGDYAVVGLALVAWLAALAVVWRVWPAQGSRRSGGFGQDDRHRPPLAVADDPQRDLLAHRGAGEEASEGERGRRGVGH